MCLRPVFSCKSMNGLHKSPDERPRPQPATEVAVAMEEVLAAEREARAEVELRRAECAARVAAARLQARTIVEHAEALAQAIHARTERVAAARAGALAAGVACAPCTPGALESAIDGVAARLTDDGDD